MCCWNLSVMELKSYVYEYFFQIEVRWTTKNLFWTRIKKMFQFGIFEMILSIRKNFQQRCCTLDHNKMVFDIIPKWSICPVVFRVILMNWPHRFIHVVRSCDISGIITRCETFKPRLISSENDLQSIKWKLVRTKARKLSIVGLKSSRYERLWTSIYYLRLSGSLS